MVLGNVIVNVTISRRLFVFAQLVVGTSVTVNNNSPIQDYVQPDDQI